MLLRDLSPVSLLNFCRFLLNRFCFESSLKILPEGMELLSFIVTQALSVLAECDARKQAVCLEAKIFKEPN